jgi:lysozyme family protein
MVGLDWLRPSEIPAPLAVTRLLTLGMLDDDAIGASILAFEGDRYTNHPADRGGPTKFGITRAAWASYLKVPVASITAEEIEGLTRLQAVNYYHAMHLRPFRALDGLALRHQMIDLGVHRGVETAGKVLQRIVGTEADGKVGPATRAAVDRFGSVLCNNVVVGARIQHFVNMIVADPAQARWRPGWWNRALSFYVEDGE